MTTEPTTTVGTGSASKSRLAADAFIMMRVIRVAAAAAVTGVAVSTASASITIPTVAIGNAGNAADYSGYGAVAYSYNIGTHEVTNAQYTAFLNAVAATDTYSLYNSNMAGVYGGITRSGSDGSYNYAAIAGRENHPVTSVSFWNATRFANWLSNGQGGAGSTETGTYTLGGVVDPVNSSVTRNANSTWAITSEDEWYKAAYFQPAGQGGQTNPYGYWQYPTQSNDTPGPSAANCQSVIGNTTAVGSYAPNYYGTLDMGGNVWEWNESIIVGGGHSGRALRGGSFYDYFSYLDSTFRFDAGPGASSVAVGFRVSQLYATAVPGAGLAAIGSLGLAGCILRRRRR